MTPRRVRAAGFEGARRSLCSVLVTCLLLSSGCGGRSTTGPTIAVPVSGGAQGYQHALAMNYYMLCESPEGRLRCRGLHPVGMDAEAWMPYADGFRDVTLAGAAVCGLRDGRVVCWGEDPSLQYVSDSGDLSAPYCSEHTFYGLTGVRELAMSEDGGCAITEERQVRCWGWTLALDDPDDLTLYTVAEDAHGLAVGSGLGCALTTEGIRCWGEPVGRPIEADPLPPGESYRVNVPQPVQVVAGESFACARSADQRVFCWGYDMAGTLGLGPDDGDDHFRPRLLPGLRAVDLVAGESAVCARTPDGKSYCWGDNHAGQLGLGHTRAVDVPTHVPALDGAVDVALGPDALCARFASGETRCAGDFTPLLPGNDVDVMPPQRLPGGPVSRLLLAEGEACVLRSDGVTCYGDGGYLRRGHQEAAAGWPLNDLDEAMLTHVSSNNPLVRCRRWSTGRVRCDAPAGSGGAAPVELRDTRGFATAGNTVCVISQDQKVLCWSRGRSDSPPTEVPGITGAESLALLGRRGCVVTAHGGLSCWTVDQSSLTHSAGPGVSLTDARSVALYSDRTCVLRRGGEVSCWDGHDPQQGDITGVAELVTYGRDICALQAGQVRCLRFEGRQVSLGDPVPGVSGVVELASGGEYLCARSESGSVQCWGRNRRSQFGVVPPMLRIALTEISNTTAEPELPVTLECGPGPQEAEDGYGSGDEQGYGEGNDFEHEMSDYYEDGPI